MLCEKPLCGMLPDTERVLDGRPPDRDPAVGGVRRSRSTRNWTELKRLIADGAIGELMEIKSNFHFTVRNPANIRLSRRAAGRARCSTSAATRSGWPRSCSARTTSPAWARARAGGDGVDVDTWGVLGYPGGRRLMLSCGFGRSYDTFTTLEGTGGQIHVTNPFHPGPDDSYQVIRPGSDQGPRPGRPGRAVVHAPHRAHRRRAARRAGSPAAGHRHRAAHRAGPERPGGVYRGVAGRSMR